ncbi:MAG TPA: fluoride efflux transporter CrcB [Amaricoccus sp.]|nr:fluoride efflux transporter CrcB [Amaricoccus sp.]
MGFLVVFIGAGFGGALRHAVNLASARLLGIGFPWGTLTVNVAGSFLMGVLIGYGAQRTGMPQHVRLFLTTGMLGGFTTFSTFSLDTAALWESHRSLTAAAYVALSVIGSIAAIFVGMALVRVLFPPVQG